MAWQYTPYILLLLLGALISLGLALYAWRHRSVPGAVIFIVLVLAVADWCLGYSLEILSIDLSAKIFWGKVQYFGISALPVAWLTFAIQYTRRDSWLPRRNLLLLAVIPLITILLVWTNEVHGLIWSQVTLDVNGPFPAMSVSYGPWFWVQWVYAYILILLGTLLLIRIVTSFPDLYRWQAILLLFGAIAPWVGNAVYILDLTWIPNLDLTPFAFSLSGAAMGWNLFRFGFFDIVPVARRTIVDSMSDAVIVLDTRNRIVDLNPAARRLIGYVGADAIGQSSTQVLGGWAELLTQYRYQVETRTELVKDEPDGLRHFEVQISPLQDQHKRPTGRLIVVRDITERKQAEQSLAQARDQALETSRLKSQFLATVSHELRTPLNAILGFTEMLQAGVYGSMADKQLSTTQKIISSATDLTVLVNEMLDQAHLETGELELTVCLLAPSDLITRLNSTLASLAEGKGLQLITTIDDNMPATLLGDPYRLYQILTNLVGNAIKFTEQGQVKVRFFRANETHWSMQVSDTGPGIAAEAQQFIFDVFRQVDGSTTRKHGGSGLGLSINKRLVTLMGGQITVESELGQGSTFTVLLPLAHDQETTR